MVQMFPLILTLIPLFILFRNLGLVNTRLSVLMPDRPGLLWVGLRPSGKVTEKPPVAEVSLCVAEAPVRTSVARYTRTLSNDIPPG